MAGGTQVLARYARALHELAAPAGAVEKVGADLGELGKRLQASPEVRRQLASPRLPRAAKREVLAGLLPAGAHDLLRRTLLLLVDKGRGGEVAELPAAWDEVALAASGRAIAKVTSAAPLDDVTRGRIAAQLARLTGKTIVMQESVDPSLLGGARILVGSRLLDGSLAARLESLQQRLLAAPLPSSD